MDGRERFLAAARALDPVRPSTSFKQSFYVDPPDGGIHGRIARWFRREPEAHVLALGGIGSGKTTELLKSREAIEGEGTAHAWHVELDAYFDLGKPREGMLVAAAGLAILQRLKRADVHVDALLRPGVVALHESLRVRRRPAPELVLSEDIARGASAPPRTAASLAEAMAPLIARWSSLSDRPSGVVLLVDGMDRCGFDDFVTMVREDLPCLRRCRVGVAIVGNVGWRHGLDAEMRAEFHEHWTQPSYDPEAAENARFLGEVIGRRAPGVFSEAARAKIAAASGGVLRDLVALARHAVYEALDDRAELVGVEHAGYAIGAHRVGCLQGLDSAQLAALTLLERDAVQPDRGVGDELQARGCAVWRDDHWEVHPAVRAPPAAGEAA